MLLCIVFLKYLGLYHVHVHVLLIYTDSTCKREREGGREGGREGKGEGEGGVSFKSLTAALCTHIETHVVIEMAHQFQVPVGSLAVHDAVSLLCHEQTERQTEVCLQQSLAQTVR